MKIFQIQYLLQLASKNKKNAHVERMIFLPYWNMAENNNYIYN